MGGCFQNVLVITVNTASSLCGGNLQPQLSTSTQQTMQCVPSAYTVLCHISDGTDYDRYVVGTTDRDCPRSAVQTRSHSGAYSGHRPLTGHSLPNVFWRENSSTRW
jgi:hypothetical protein